MNVHYHNYVLVLLVLLATVVLSNQAQDTDVQHRKDLNQINYYNWLLHRHRTERQKIEKVNNDIRDARLIKLQQILDSPAPQNVTLIATQSDFSRISRLVHPVSNKPVTDSVDELNKVLGVHRRQARKGAQSDAAAQKPEDLVEFQISEREYEKFSKFFNNRTMRKKVA
ncbi:Neuropeptide-Like Protein [Caenorhabditis elegans]|uniref:Neuropeptide-Like Protein n=1 Tax=Caenorhabditis elegans TaxID=6239 RepID=Q9U3G9_CAEEL|nr:Neuropeptide-Like Protein [Caenorhabditis elegans]CAB54242.1 Neuropeptide-Like Protein [Caenorhabditis elegans]|eukprot:NP_496364.1 Uncharacterized protein CELE_F33A8.7 [Caenorhabditis elegans]